MVDLNFSRDLVIWIALHRHEWLIYFFKFFNFWGNWDRLTLYTEGTLLIIMALFWFYNKDSTLKLILVFLLSSYLSLVLKIIIRNPRPFADPRYEDTFSTPSGQTMRSTSFWGYLYGRIKRHPMLVLSILMILLIGLARVYLGVNYFEDVLLGWGLGVVILFFFVRYENTIINWWQNWSEFAQIAFVFGCTSFIWIVIGMVTNYEFQALGFATNGGFLSGVILGTILERERIDFNVKSRKPIYVILRYVIGFILVFIVLIGLGEIFRSFGEVSTFIQFFLQYLHYCIIGLMVVFGAPWIFVRLRLADSKKIAINND